jgi:hypothetical protein
MKKNPAAVKYLEEIQAQGRTIAAYDVAAAMAQAQRGIDLAERHKNPMAFIKGCELRAKLSGLLVDRVEISTMDLVGSIEQARHRVLNITPQSLPSRGPIDWRPHIQGSPVVAPEAGPPDDELGCRVENGGLENR